MRRLVPILVVLAIVSCEQGVPETAPLVLPLNPAPLGPWISPAVAPIPTEVDEVEPATPAIELRCPAGASIGGALPPEGTEAWCQLADGTRHGRVVAFFDGGRLRSEKLYERGRKAGVWTTYFPDGVLESQVVHTGDTEEHHTDYRTDGSRARAGGYRGGERYGVWVEWTTDGSFREIEYALGGEPKSKLESETGIPACDEYIENYRACIADHVPAAARVPMERAMDATVKAFRDAARGSAREKVMGACKVARDAAMTATASMGCKW